jgi:hypothetical protein
LDIQPRLTWTKGEDLKHRGTGEVWRQAEYGRWSIRSSLPVGSEVEDQCMQLLKLLRPHKELIINDILKSAKCIVEIGGRTYDISGQVGVYLPDSILKELNEYNAEIDIDIYSHDRYEAILNQRINELLYYVWDPIGVSSEGTPITRNEYDYYVEYVCNAVLEGQSQQQICSLLDRYATERMGLSSNKDHDYEVAGIILKSAKYLKDGLD